MVPYCRSDLKFILHFDPIIVQLPCWCWDPWEEVDWVAPNNWVYEQTEWMASWTTLRCHRAPFWTGLLDPAWDQKHRQCPHSRFGESARSVRWIWSNCAEDICMLVRISEKGIVLAISVELYILQILRYSGPSHTPPPRPRCCKSKFYFLSLNYI